MTKQKSKVDAYSEEGNRMRINCGKMLLGKFRTPLMCGSQRVSFEKHEIIVVLVHEPDPNALSEERNKRIWDFELQHKYEFFLPNNESLRFCWHQEAQKWLLEGRSTKIVSGSKMREIVDNYDLSQFDKLFHSE